jgi:hypothetical protein
LRTGDTNKTGLGTLSIKLDVFECFFESGRFKVEKEKKIEFGLPFQHRIDGAWAKPLHPLSVPCGFPKRKVPRPRFF